MKKRIVSMALLLFLACGLLTGCAQFMKNEVLEEQLEIYIAAMNRDDPDAIYAALYPGAVTREEFDAGYQAMREHWKAAEDYTIKPVNIHTAFVNSTKTYAGEYLVTMGDIRYTVKLQYRTDKGGKGITVLNLVPETEAPPSDRVNTMSAGLYFPGK